MDKEKLKENIENVFYTFTSIIKILKNSKLFIDINYKNDVIKECIVLGNGPSLKDSLKRDFHSLIENKKIFCVNAFAIAKEYEEIQPDYYVFADPGFWTENPREEMRTLRDEIFNSIVEKTKWEISIFFPYEVKGCKIIEELQKNNQHISIIFYNKVSAMGFRFFRNIMYKLNLGMPRAQNVLIPTLILALNLGFKKIYLFGADHSWHENLILTKDNILCSKEVHFYDNKEVANLIPLKDNITHKNIKVHEEFYSIYITLKIYFYIKEYSKTKNATIINGSSKTFIDAFERMIL